MATSTERRYIYPIESYAVSLTHHFGLFRETITVTIADIELANSQLDICRLTMVRHGSRFLIDDIYGTGFYSLFSNRGIGTLFLNSALGYLSAYYPPETVIYGQLSTDDDPLPIIQQKLYSACCARRRHFFSRYGFVFESESPLSWFSGPLSSLDLVVNGLFLGRHPRYIPFTDFIDVSPGE